MQLVIFSVHDQKAEAFIQPFYAPNVAMAIRMFSTAANDPSTQFAQNPGDYTLFEIGRFDQDTGEILSAGTPINHGLAIQHQQTLHPILKEVASGE